MKQNSLRVLEDYELDHVSGGFDGDADFYADPFVVPDGFTMENISGAILQQDHATGEWTVELVFESDFTEAGYASSDPADGGGGGRYYEIMPAGQSSWDSDPGALMAGGQRTTQTTKVTTTKTTGFNAQVTINIPFLGSITLGGERSTTTTTETTTTSQGRITSQGKVGRLPSK